MYKDVTAQPQDGDVCSFSHHQLFFLIQYLNIFRLAMQLLDQR